MLVETFQKHYQKHGKAAPVMSFALGFLFDIATMGRIDSWLMITQQAIYLLIISGLLVFEFWESQGQFVPGRRISKFWSYQQATTHFLLGALLSAYTLFYFKSASVITAFVFLTVLSSLLIANEFQRVRGMGATLRVTMLILCVASYFIYTTPIFFGSIGTFTFILALLISFGVGYTIFRTLRKRVTDKLLLRRQILYPLYGVHAGLAVLYFLHAIPPVPLSVSYMGLYHNIEREGEKYKLTYTRPAWKFWEHGDQTFVAQSEDKLYGFASIFSPSGFKDKVNVRWLLKEPKYGWKTQDVIPITIVGGRDEGFRGYTVKEHFRPGKWRFQVETEDGREIGRLYFVVKESKSASPPIARVEYR